MASILLRKTMTMIGLALALTMGTTSIAHAEDVNANHYAQSEWRQVVLNQSVVTENGNTYLPLRSTLNALGAELEWKPEGKNIVQITTNEKTFDLFLKEQGKQLYVSTSADQAGDALVVKNGVSYMSVNTLQQMLNRTACVSGNNQVTLVDYQPNWNNGTNTHALWSGELQASVALAPAQAPAAQPAQPAAQTPAAPAAKVQTSESQALQPQAPAETPVQQTPAPVATAVAAPAPTVTMEEMPLVSVAGNGKYAKAVSIAQQFYGVPYVWGGTTPAGFDCSGLTSYVYRQMGVNIPRTSQQQQAAAQMIPLNQAQPGDLVFWGYPATHVGIYVGNGQYIHAAASGQVELGNYSWYPYTSVGRIG